VKREPWIASISKVRFKTEASIQLRISRAGQNNMIGATFEHRFDRLGQCRGPLSFFLSSTRLTQDPGPPTSARVRIYDGRYVRRPLLAKDIPAPHL